jgi:hypothetical protein
MLKIEGVEFTDEDLQAVVEVLKHVGFPGGSDEEIAKAAGFQPSVIAQIRGAWILTHTPSPRKAPVAQKPGVTTVDDLDKAYILRRSRIGDSPEALAARLDVSLEAVTAIISQGA